MTGPAGGFSAARAFIVALAALAITALWMLGHDGRDLERAICPQPVSASGRTVSCDGPGAIVTPSVSTRSHP